MKKILFVLSKPPHCGSYVQEALDIIMTCAAFEQAVSVLFLDKAVFHLKQLQRPETAGLKDIAAMYRSLPLYDIKMFVEIESLQEQGLSIKNLAEPASALTRSGLGDFFRQFDLVVPG